MTEQTMVERVARAIHAADDMDESYEDMKSFFDCLARAAIAAMREPTVAMEQAYYRACDENGMCLWKSGYRAMVDAALEEPGHAAD